MKQSLHLLELAFVQVFDLLVQRQVVHIGAHIFATASTDAHHLESGAVDALRQLVHCDVAGRTHQHLSVLLLHKMVDQSGASDRLTRTRRTLDEAQGSHKRFFNSVVLEVIQLGLSFY